MKHKVIGIKTYEDFIHYHLKAVHNIGASGKLEVIIHQNENRFWFIKLVDEENIEYASGLQDFIEGEYFLDERKAKLEFYRNQKVLAFSNMDQKKRWYEDAKARNKKVDVLKAIRIYSKEEVRENAVRGQYNAGWIMGKEVKAYRDESNVNPNSNTETFAAVKFMIDNWRWNNVPFYVRSGKYMHEKLTSIIIQFKEAPKYSFPDEAAETLYCYKEKRRIIYGEIYCTFC
jgi:hypothetical protein